MDPSRSWLGFVNGSSVGDCRQIQLSSSDVTGTSTTLVVLWSELEHDILIIVELDNYETVRSSSSVELPHKNCRLVAADQQIVCQGPAGEILQCLSLEYEHDEI